MKRGYAAAALLAFCALLCIVSSFFVHRESNEILSLLDTFDEKLESGGDPEEAYRDLHEKCEEAEKKLNPFIGEDLIEQLENTVDSMEAYVKSDDIENLEDYAAVCRNIVESWRFSLGEIL